MNLRASRRSRLAGLLILLVLGVFAFAACGDSDDDASSGAPTLANPAETGEARAIAFLEALKSGDAEALDEVLGPGFILVRANGGVVLRADYIANPAIVNAYEVSGFTAVQSGGVLSVSYQTVIDSVIDGVVQPGAPAPRLSVFQWLDGEWRLTAHSNFGAIPQ